MSRLTCLVIFFILATPGFATTNVNETTRMCVIQNLLEKGTVWTEGSYYFNYVDMAFDRGHFYSSQLPLLPCYSALVSKPLHLITGFGTAEGRMVLYYWIVLTTSGLGFWFIYVLTAKLCRRIQLFQGQEGWILAAIFLGSPLLAAAPAYTSHILEGALGLAGLFCLLRHRQKPDAVWAFGAGAVLALSSQLHPLAGGIFLISAGLYFLIRRWRHGLVFAAGALLILTLGAGLHFKLYGTVKPFYFSTEKYLFMIDAETPNEWLREPSNPGLTEAKLKARIEELRVPAGIAESSLVRFKELQGQKKNWLSTVVHQWKTYDYLTFNPLVFFCFWIVIRSALDRTFIFRAEWIWVLAAVAGLYAAILLLGAKQGWCFSDRYLIPILPIVLFAGASGIRSASDRRWFLVLFWVSLGMMLPGHFRPWRLNPDDFNFWNLRLQAGLTAVTVLFAARPRWQDAAMEWWFTRIAPRGWTALGVAVFIAAECCLRLKGQFTPHDIVRLQVIAPAFVFYFLSRENSGERGMTGQSGKSCEASGGRVS